MSRRLPKYFYKAEHAEGQIKTLNASVMLEVCINIRPMSHVRFLQKVEQIPYIKFLQFDHKKSFVCDFDCRP